MKLVVILICIIGLTGSYASVYSQQTKLDLNVQKATVKDVLKLIEDQSEFSFMYNASKIDVYREINLNVEKSSVEDILKKIFAGEDVSYRILGRNIIISSNSEVNETAQQQKPVSGKVTDSSGSPLPGVSVVLKGTTTGTITDFDGKYTLTNVPGDATFIFSFVGMKTQEISVKGKTSINVTLEEATIGIDEVVAIGYGTVKKANLTGSVATVNAQELIKRPVANPVNLLQGKVSGLQVIQASSTPGEENNVMRIRGTGTFSAAGSDPLVLIDGISRNMTNLDPNDIESISVLKDAASCAIYGARAANGVILITTKRGKSGRLNIEYHGNIQAHQATSLPKLLTNSADYMTYWNEAKLRIPQVPHFSQETIDAFRNNPNDPNYPNTDWIDLLFRTGIAYNHHLSVNGGNEKTTFNLALGYLDQDGIISIYDFKKYNALLSVDTKVNDWIKIGGTMELIKKDITKNVFDSYNDYFPGVFGIGPNMAPTITLPDGSTGYVVRYSSAIGETTQRNPLAMDAAGTDVQNIYNMATQFYAEVKLPGNIKWLTKGGINIEDSFRKRHEHAVNTYFFKEQTFAGTTPRSIGVADTYIQNVLTTLYSTLNYSKTLNENHNIGVLVGYNQESNFARVLVGSKVTFPTENLKELNAGSATGQASAGTANEWAIQSFFGRIAYDFKSKYLFEANARYDGTSRIAPETRWGIFPSVSAAWRISNESFAQNFAWLTNLKLRGSWGKLGNQNVGLYPYQEVLTTTAYPFTSLSPGVIAPRMVDKSLKWETTTATDFGLDISVNKGIFSATIDWYDKVTDDILYQIPVPASVGLAAPTSNYGKMKNTGWDVELGHRNTVNDFAYDVSVNFSTYKNEVLRVVAPSYGNYWITQEGIPYQSFYMIEMIGIFQDQAEIDAGPTHPYNPKPGDPKYRDANGDNIIDAKDRVVIDGAHPKFYYGGSLNLKWKNFDMSAFFQGVYGQKFFGEGGWGIQPFAQGSAPTLDFVKNHWTPENRTNKYPAMYIPGYGPTSGFRNSLILYDASYVRLKNIAIGYNVSRNFSKKIGLEGLRVYVSGDNLLTIANYPELDPERVGTTGRMPSYPQVKIFTLGIKANL